MTTSEPTHDDLRALLVGGIRAGRDAERTVLAAVDPTERDAPTADGGWSPKDIQTHLAAWQRDQADRMAARREGRVDDPSPAIETDERNAIIQAERVDWGWEQVVTDAEASTDALCTEIEAASDDALADDRVLGTIMGNGPEHTLGHLPDLAVRAGLEPVVLDLADSVERMVDRAALPSRPAAFTRYNLACFHAKGGRLDEARTLLRSALPEQEELRTLAPTDDDLIALRSEIPALTAG